MVGAPEPLGNLRGLATATLIVFHALNSVIAERRDVKERRDFVAVAGLGH